MPVSISPYLYLDAKLPGPGAENLAFRMLGLPPISAYGPGVMNQEQLKTFAASGLQRHVIGIQGFGGNPAGQFLSSALLDVSSFT